VRINVGDLTTQLTRRLSDVGMSPQDAARTAAHYVAGDIIGHHGHGVFRTVGALSLRYSDRDLEARTHGSITTIDAGGLGGIPATVRTCESAIRGLTQSDVSVRTIRNYRGGTGSLGWYCKLLADAGLVSFVFCNSESAVAIPGTGIPFGGTNPIAFGIPGDPPLIVDFASTVVAYGELRIRALNDEPLDEGVVVDSGGEPSVRYSDADNGAMLGIGGHKGFALSLAIEVLCGYLAGAKIAREEDKPDGLVLIVMGPTAAERPEAATLAAEQLRALSPTARLPGSRHAEVPSSFLLRNDAIHALDRTWIEIPDPIIAFLADKGLGLFN
jgi:LDH2 family malate/lactate/ureidoglycolate dehydrogenase